MKLSKNLMKLLSSDIEPKISIIMPIYQQTQQVEVNLITYKNLLKEVKKELGQYPRREWIKAVEQLESLLLDRKLWNETKTALLIFTNNEAIEICEVEHQVAAKSHVGSTFLVQDLLLPEEQIHRANFLIDLSRDRIRIYDVSSLKRVKLEGLHTHFSNYYDDFDVKSKINFRSVGKATFYHGHNAKSEQQEKEQSIYYRYLDRKLKNLHLKYGYEFLITGLPTALDNFLKLYAHRKYVSGIIHDSMANLSHSELKERISKYYAFERIARIESVKQKIIAAHKGNQLLNDLKIIEFALNNRDVQTLISFNDGKSYSIAHNKLLIKSLLNKINCRVIYTSNFNRYSSMNAILY